MSGHLAKTNENLTDFENRLCFKSIIEHWAEARIDGPMQAIARYDDAAKQLITIGGIMQGGLVAVYSILGQQQQMSMSGWQKAGTALFIVSLLAFLSLAAWACSLQPEMQANRISGMLKKAIQQCLCEDDLAREVEDWCRDVGDKVRYKRRLMLWAKALFILCSLVMMVLLFSLLPGTII